MDLFFQSKVVLSRLYKCTVIYSAQCDKIFVQFLGFIQIYQGRYIDFYIAWYGLTQNYSTCTSLNLFLLYM